MVKKIALEEHVLAPGLIDYWRPTMTTEASISAFNQMRRAFRRPTG